MENPFKDAHKALKQRQYRQVLASLLDSRGRLKAAFKSYPNHAFYILGNIYYKKADYVGAIRYFRRSLNADKSDYQALWAIADCYSDSNRPRLAERYYLQALKLAKSNLSNLRYNLGNALFDQGRYADAVSIYKTVGKGSTSYPRARKNLKLALTRMG